MRAGKELNLAIASEVMGHAVSRQKNGTYMEATPKGVRPLAPYSSDMNAAWEVAQKIGVTLIPIADGSWFSFVGKKAGWNSPAEFMEALGKADFVRCAAAVDMSAPLSICIAAVKSIENRRTAAENTSENSERPSDSPESSISH